MITDLLNNFILDSENAEHNYALARYYHDLEQTASAVSYYLRCAERTKDKNLQYACMVYASNCFVSQGTRKLSVKGLLQHAIALLPNRPEAYFFLSKQYESEHVDAGRWMNAYLSISLGVDKPEPQLPLYGYPGKHAMLIQKAHCAWWSGLCDEARDILMQLVNDLTLPTHLHKLVYDNISVIAEKAGGLHSVYYTDVLQQFLKEHSFDWGAAANNAWFKRIVEQEIFEQDVYQKFRKVHPGDVVFDIGASVGPFAYKIRDAKASKIVCIEPHVELFKTLQRNTTAICINKAIGNVDGFEHQAGLFNENFIETQEKDNSQLVPTITFESLLSETDTKHIDFLKIDCEGGEYSIFTPERISWVRQNVKYIVGEWHLSNDELRQQFRTFRDTYLSIFKNHEIYSFDGVNIKHDLWTDWFIDYYKTITIYIDNTSHFGKLPKQRSILKRKALIPDKWKYSISPTMEITTIIPEKGCVVDCVFCPQRTLVNVYEGERRLSLDNFKLAIDKIPTQVRITFAGFTEPWLNSNCTDMLLYAHDKGHPISVFTTVVGMKPSDIERIKHIPFAGNPNGGFVVHLPDQERRAKHPITKRYIETLEYIKSVQHEIKNFTVMSMGTVHNDIKHIYDWAPTYEMWSRAGNLIGEKILKPELLAHPFKIRDHGDKAMTCGCDERLYHNVMLPNGDISLCCMDYGLDQIIGNIFEQEYNDVIPEPYEVFKLCNLCENAIDVNSVFIKEERKMYNV